MSEIKPPYGKDLVQNGVEIRKVTVKLEYTDFIDGGEMQGSYALKDIIPAGAMYMGFAVRDVTGFTGGVAATIWLEDEELSIFDNTPAARSLNVYVSNDDEDFTDITAGEVTIDLYYLRPVG